jgi:hypothetical protein
MMEREEEPLSLTIPMPPSPLGVDIATIVSCCNAEFCI